MVVSGQFHASAALRHEKESSSARWIGGWVGARIGLDAGIEHWPSLS
jgi:hypothetical protein